MKTILLIGAGSAIGQATREILESGGASVVAWSREGSEGSIAIGDYVDGNIPEIPEAIDGLVYLPGTVRLAPFHRIPIEKFREDWEINVGGFIRMLQSAIPALSKGTDSSVVAVSTVAVGTGLGFHASVSQAKGALEGLIRALAAEYAQKGIRFNAVAPSLTDTPLTHSMVSTDEKKQRMGQRHPLGRIGEPEDIAHTIAFLLSEQASWITGQVIGVDGGLGSLRL
jgi:NAD(P)-dependent dehydrogenase (short-subunit alcohol dehydrogenase family)